MDKDDKTIEILNSISVKAKALHDELKKKMDLVDQSNLKKNDIEILMDKLKKKN